jgi:hypothetical protein
VSDLSLIAGPRFPHVRGAGLRATRLRKIHFENRLVNRSDVTDSVVIIFEGETLPQIYDLIDIFPSFDYCASR